MLFIRNYTWGYQVFSGGVGWKREILWDDVIARGIRGFSCVSRTCFCVDQQL